MKAGVLVKLSWRPRDENASADALTNLDFSSVRMEDRIACCWEDIELGLLWTFWREREAYLDRDAVRNSAKIVKLGDFEKSAW